MRSWLVELRIAVLGWASHALAADEKSADTIYHNGFVYPVDGPKSRTEDFFGSDDPWTSFMLSTSLGL